jgi:STE24 endopeptidase
VTVEPPLFTAEQIERSRRYRLPLYWAFLAGSGIDLAALSLLAFGSPGHALADALGGLPAGAWALSFAAACAGILTVLRLPIAFWSGFFREHSFGLSTQTALGWLADWAKGTLVAILLSGLWVLGFVECARALPSAWPAVAAPGAALLVLVLGFLSPVVFEPLFNRFESLEDGELTRSLHSLADRAGVPVREILVADASRRTRKVNAYVSGLGRSRRVVLFDTLLASSRPPEIRLVVAHELAHRRYRHVALGTVLGMAGAAAAVLLLWLALRWGSLLAALHATGPGDPPVAPFLLLFGDGLELLALPFAAALSRRMERTADRFSLELTDDLPAFEGVHRALAVTNLADLAPPRLAYLLLFTHPTQPERIEAARERRRRMTA